MHHIVEDFLTKWTTPNVHGTPLRRFLEACTGRDLRARPADDCFHIGLTHRKLPLGCEVGWLEGRGLRVDQWDSGEKRVYDRNTRQLFAK